MVRHGAFSAAHAQVKACLFEIVGFQGGHEGSGQLLTLTVGEVNFGLVKGVLVGELRRSRKGNLLVLFDAF